MQENNFEKQVQQKMEELSFTPSAPVWQKVEAQIQRKKDRRRLVLWLLPLLLVGGGLWLYTTTGKLTSENNIATTQNTTSATPATPLPQNDNASTINSQKENKKFTSAAPNNKTAAIRGTLSSENKAGSTAAKASSKRELKSFTTQKTLAVAKSNNKKKNPATTVSKTVTPVVENELSTITEIAISNDVTAVESDLVFTPTVVVNNEHAIDIALDSINPLPLKEARLTPVKVATRKPWQWEVVASIGTSVPRGALFNNMGAKALQDQYSSPANSAGGGGGNLFYQPPSQPTKGLSFTVGAALKESVGKKSFLHTGLQYSYYSTHLQVGTALKDSTITLSNNSVARYAAYRNNTDYRSYTNQYHFIELPLAFEYRPLRAWPLQVQHGLSVGYLLHSNAVQYDHGVNVYYEDQSPLHKTSLQLFTAVDYRLISTKKLALYGGPILKYGIRPMQQNSSVAKNHMLTAGWQTRISF